MKTKAKILLGIGIGFLIFTILSVTKSVPNLVESSEEDSTIQTVIGIGGTLAIFVYLGEFTFGIIHGLIKKNQKMGDARFLLINITNI